jgi:sarcosine oxidase
MFDFTVVGKGLIGSAAARYLSATDARVALIGPGEPDDWGTHEGVFASHYDEGRITRILDPDEVWATLAKRSIEQYETIERDSGMRFYHRTGGLRVDPDRAQLAQVEAVGQGLVAEFTACSHDDLENTFSYFTFPAEMTGLWETGPAGWISPRTLVRAQTQITAQQGATIIDEPVTSIRVGREAVTISTTSGSAYESGRVLLATGAYTNSLLDRKLDLTPRPRTILLAELGESELAHLHNMPTLIYRMPSNPDLPSIYMLPPIQYPDGRYYLKIGGVVLPEHPIDSPDQLGTWFRGGGSETEAARLKQVLLGFLPGLDAVSYHYKPCVYTDTAHNRPYVDVIEEGRLYVAAGGCGMAAKSSNEIGRLGASLVEHDSWIDDLDGGAFRAQYRQ